ncbi:hypothetical protein FRX31_011599 [Thalictrum thalictroides]|uniref:Kinesin motor domain-containing protein n=1 Tax=Thalictrum thalictroides TaxID=46969 RepID=A0A7J6WN50_THATH|nr:hypothetical protein FRX31_011599 [Thalictrum thalictroides]
MSNVVYEGLRLQEIAKINNGKSRMSYRESKLTWILQDNLGGTSHSLMVACPDRNSVNTVSLAACSRQFCNGCTLKIVVR